MNETVGGLEGQSFGCLTVIEQGSEYVWAHGQRREPRWRCRCRCGREAEYRESRLKSRPPWRCAACAPAVATMPDQCQWCDKPRYYRDPPACRSCKLLADRNGTCHRCDKPRRFAEGCVCAQGIRTRSEPPELAKDTPEA